MSDGKDGKRLTRRRVLAGVAGAAGVGMIGGAGTRAFLQDRETIPGSALGNPYEGSYLDLELSCEDTETAGCSTAGDGVSLSFADVAPGDEGTTQICLGVAGNPAWAWLRTTPLDTPLTRNFIVSLTYADDGTPVPDPDPTVSGGIENYSLREFFQAFSGGGLLAGGGPNEALATSGGRCLDLSWSFSSNDPALSNESVEFTLRFAAVQYRADVSDPSTTNPWGQQ